jgi:hypothetical protein
MMHTQRSVTEQFPAPTLTRANPRRRGRKATRPEQLSSAEMSQPATLTSAFVDRNLEATSCVRAASSVPSLTTSWFGTNCTFRPSRSAV